MEHYYVNKNAQTSGEHEVHTDKCIFFSDIINRLYLGYFATCEEAIKEAKKHYLNVDGCYYCCPKCHKK